MPTLNWTGKDKVINHHIEVPYKTLEHQYGFDNGNQSDDATNSGNKIIHGDNLEALKALLPEYEGKIKCIYIDPPYNTGNEGWVYNDNVNDPKIKKWLEKVVGKEGEDLSRHDKWLCMMYPRLQLLHKLLADDGYIFISINFYDESANLRLICDEIFGINNFIGELTWESTTQPINSGIAKFRLQQKVEPILLLTKRKSENYKFILKELDSELKYPHIGKFGKCRFEIIEKSNAGEYKRPTMQFEILGQKPRKGKRWQIGKETAYELAQKGRIEIVDGIVKKAIYPEDEIDKKKFKPFWSHFTADIVGTALTGKELLNEIMDSEIGFDTVKPIELIKQLISYIPKNSIILDSFAGSGTTAHAVLNLNKQDGGNRKFILVEMEDYAEDITAERVRRVIKGYGKDNKAVEGTGGSFDFYELGKPLFLENEMLNEEIDLEKIREYIWFSETRLPYKVANSEEEYLLGATNTSALYFYYQKDKLTTLDDSFLRSVRTKAEQYIIYADNCILDKDIMQKYHIIFKKIPRDITRF